MSKDVEEKIQDAIANPQNMGEMVDADAVGTVGSPDCGDMLRMWLKFTEKDGKKVIDKASFQSFGCQTAIAVASMATEMLSGKTVEEAKAMSSEDLSEPLGPLPPMKIHCGQMVEGALKEALEADNPDKAPTGDVSSPEDRPSTLMDSFHQQGPALKKGGLKIVLEEED
ncbi:MAG: iron-sulfur cluster assembly scaffold protein [Verrucomicrobiales bacterium]|nr:iron-sulfur cluster assembly scaffold protein [Verrucomicrobiales bacterium]